MLERTFFEMGWVLRFSKNDRTFPSVFERTFSFETNVRRTYIVNDPYCTFHRFAAILLLFHNIDNALFLDTRLCAARSYDTSRVTQHFLDQLFPSLRSITLARYISGLSASRCFCAPSVNFGTASHSIFAVIGLGPWHA